MYHFPNQQLYHHNPYEQFPNNIQDGKLQSLNTISELYIVNNAQAQAESTIEQLPEVAQADPLDIVSVKKKKSAPKKPKVQTAEGDESKKPTKKPAADTSKYSVEERLVAAVWVHEREYTSSTISEIKHNFRRRFGRDPPSKTTLFAWEGKLFSTGNVCDAPRTGRPMSRKSHISKVAASVRSAPTLSLRARALALRMSRSTLHNILRNDLPHATHHTDKQAPKRRIKQSLRRNEPQGQQTPPPAPPTPPPHVHYVMHAMHPHAHSHGHT